jgi:hypothetical protein
VYKGENKRNDAEAFYLYLKGKLSKKRLYKMLLNQTSFIFVAIALQCYSILKYFINMHAIAYIMRSSLDIKPLRTLLRPNFESCIITSCTGAREGPPPIVAIRLSRHTHLVHFNVITVYYKSGLLQ